MGSSVDAYVQKAAEVIRTNFRSTGVDGGMTAARAGFLIKHLLGEFPPPYYRLKDILAELERRGDLKLGLNDKGALAIWLQDASPAAPAPAPAIPNYAPFRRLKSNVWLAFVSSAPTNKRYIQRQSGEVRVGLQSPPLPSDAWIEVKPVTVSDDQKDALAFIEQEKLSESLLIEAVQSRDWARFLEMLREIEPHLPAKWNRRRSNRVIAHVEAWRINHGVDESVLYETSSGTDETAQQLGKHISTARLREGLLRALGKMSTEDLLTLPIPARFLIEAIRPDLLT